MPAHDIEGGDDCELAHLLTLTRQLEPYRSRLEAAGRQPDPQRADRLAVLLGRPGDAR